MYSFMGGGLFCAGMENILLIVSTATDYWMQYRQSNNYMHQSLWRYCTPGKCFPFRIKDSGRIISLLICVIGIIIGITALIHYSSFDRFDKTFAAGILFFITCFLVFLAMSMLTGVLINYYGKLSRPGGSARRHFYLSLSLSRSLWPTLCCQGGTHCGFTPSAHAH
uniref:Lens intrinsic membrane protein 2.1 n=1 Tax=Neolamprologus brichardi TaxID=32507 RepID=A0A3Q4GBD6_NEOBR